MLVANELGKTLSEMQDMTVEELTTWLAFYQVRDEKHEEAVKKAKRKRGRR